MKLNKSYSNEALVKALEGNKDIYADVTTDTGRYTDAQLAKLKRFANLSSFEKDLLLLTATHTKEEVADLYGVSRQYIYRLLNKVMEKL